MPKAKAVFMGSTEKSVAQSLSEINRLLVSAGAVSIRQEYADKKVTAVIFTLNVYAGTVEYRLPCRAEALIKRHGLSGDKAERIAWRQVFRWLQAQLAFAESGMSKATEVLMPYAIDRSGATLFEVWENQISRQLTSGQKPQ